MTDFFAIPASRQRGSLSLWSCPRVCGRHPSFCRHTRSLWRVSIPPRSSPQVVGGDPSEQGQDGCPIKNVGHDADGERCPINNVGSDNLPPSYPQFVAGIHQKGTQDGFPINNVGNDSEREIPAARCGACKPLLSSSPVVSRDRSPLLSYPQFVAGIHLSFVMSACVWKVSISLRSSSQVVGGDPSEQGQDKCPINNVGHDNLPPSSPQVVGGDPSEQGQDKCPIKNVGHDNLPPSYPRFQAGIHPKNKQPGFPFPACARTSFTGMTNFREQESFCFTNYGLLCNLGCYNVHSRSTFLMLSLVNRL